MGTVIAVLGADAGCGCTMCAQAMAERLGKKATVLLVCASGKFGDDYFRNREGRSLDDLKAALLSGSLEEKDFLAALVRENGIMILPGVRDAEDAGRYSAEAMECLLTAAERYEYVVLDLGNELRSAFAMRGVEMAVRRYYVLTQQEKALRRFRDRWSCVLEPLCLRGGLVVNRFRRSPALPSVKELEAEFGAPAAGVIPELDAGWQAEAEQRVLFRDGRAQKAIDGIVREIMGEEKDRRTWKRNSIFRST